MRGQRIEQWQPRPNCRVARGINNIYVCGADFTSLAIGGSALSPRPAPTRLSNTPRPRPSHKPTAPSRPLPSTPRQLTSARHSAGPPLTFPSECSRRRRRRLLRPISAFSTSFFPPTPASFSPLSRSLFFLPFHRLPLLSFTSLPLPYLFPFRNRCLLQFFPLRSLFFPLYPLSFSSFIASFRSPFASSSHFSTSSSSLSSFWVSLCHSSFSPSKSYASHLHVLIKSYYKSPPSPSLFLPFSLTIWTDRKWHGKEDGGD